MKSILVGRSSPVEQRYVSETVEITFNGKKYKVEVETIMLQYLETHAVVDDELYNELKKKCGEDEDCIADILSEKLEEKVEKIDHYFGRDW